MLISKLTQNTKHLYRNNQPIEELKKYNYLGKFVNGNNNRSGEIRTVIKLTRYIHKNKKSTLQPRPKNGLCDVCFTYAELRKNGRRRSQITVHRAI